MSAQSIDEWDYNDGDAPDVEATGQGGSEEYSRLSLDARRALTKLLTSRFVTRSRNRVIWDAILANEGEIQERLADMFLELEIDSDYEVAFKRQQFVDDVPKLLRRDKPLSRDASFLLIYLRKEHAYTDAHDDPVVVTRAQIGEFFRAFRALGDEDEAGFEGRVDTAIRAVIGLSLLTQDADAEYLFTVAPAIVPLIGMDEVSRFESYFLDAAVGPSASDAHQGGDAEPVTDEDDL